MIRKQPISMIMTEDVITLKKTDSLETAEQLFKRHNIRHIPVVDDKLIVGMLSHTDLLRLSFADVTEQEDNPVNVMVYNMFNIEQVMKRNVVSVSPSKSINR